MVLLIPSTMTTALKEQTSYVTINCLCWKLILEIRTIIHCYIYYTFIHLSAIFAPNIIKISFLNVTILLFFLKQPSQLTRSLSQRNYSVETCRASFSCRERLRNGWCVIDSKCSFLISKISIWTYFYAYLLFREILQSQKIKQENDIKIATMLINFGENNTPPKASVS